MTSQPPKAARPVRAPRTMATGDKMLGASSSQITPPKSPLKRRAAIATTSPLRCAEPRFNQHHLSGIQHDLRQAQIDVIIGLLAALRAKDEYTHHHSIRVSIMADRLAERMQLRPREASIVHVAALLHDIGKIGIPDAILTKPGPLDPDELKIMKGHSAIGAEMLRPITFLQRERLLVLHHHEWFNGQGYPAGLRAGSIPFGARILQVADCIDAMISPRTYKSSRDAAFVIEQLERGREQQFDPRVGDVAIAWLRQDRDAFTLVN